MSRQLLQELLVTLIQSIYLTHIVLFLIQMIRNNFNIFYIMSCRYYRTNWLTEKSDVYSFGVVLLEIITNQRVIERTREKPHIAEWVNLMITKGDIRKIVDPNLKGDYHSDSVWKFVELAMTCVNDSSATRPTMTQVVTELTECVTLENSRGGKSQNMGSTSSSEVTMTFDTEVNPVAR